jgi:hypothetical protein
MTTVMLATYPDVFSKGAIMAGLPYKAATSSLNAYSAMNGSVTKTPAQWGALVRAQNPGISVFPKVAIFHGTSDFTVNIANATELIKQWTYLNHADQTADSVNNAFQGNTNVQQNIYNDSLGNPAVYFYKITSMPHGIAVDTGACPRQGGATGTYALREVNFHSTYWAADFFSIIPGPYSITGLNAVASGASNISYSVPLHSGSTYSWNVPKGASILSGQGTNSITVKFGNVSGLVEVTETITGGCPQDAAKLFVTVQLASGIANLQEEQGSVFYNASENSLHITGTESSDIRSIAVYNLMGQQLSQTSLLQGNTLMLGMALKTGIYIVRIETSHKQYVCKIGVY